MLRRSDAVCDEPTVAGAILRNGCLFRAPAATTLWVNCPSACFRSEIPSSSREPVPGLGLASAKAFAEAGASVVTADRNAETIGKVAEGLRSAGHSAIGVVCDVTDKAAVTRMIDHFASHVGCRRSIQSIRWPHRRRIGGMSCASNSTPSGSIQKPTIGRNARKLPQRNSRAIGIRTHPADGWPNRSDPARKRAPGSLLMSG